MESQLISLIPELSIGVIAIGSLLYVIDRNIKQNREFMLELKEREQAFRALEKEVRTNITAQLNKNTETLKEVVVLMDKINSK